MAIYLPASAEEQDVSLDELAPDRRPAVQSIYDHSI